MSLHLAQHLWRPDLAQRALDPETPPVPMHLNGAWPVKTFEVQDRGIMWLYATPRAVLGDVTGLGKTIHMMGLILLLHATGELTGKKAVLVCEAGAVGQMTQEFADKAPSLRCATVTGGMDRQRRRTLYRKPWDVLITGYPTMWRDAALLTEQQPHLVFFDESTNFANPETKTARGANTLASVAARVYDVTATPVMLGLTDFYSQLCPLDLAGYTGSLFGGQAAFTQRYLIEHTAVRRIMGGGSRNKQTFTPNLHTLPEFQAKLSPYYLRRNTGTADMPTVMPPEDIWLDMTPRQAERYRNIANGTEAADSRFQRQMQAATTLANLGDDDESAKFDWFMDAIDRRFVDDEGRPEKVVVFLANLDAVEALRHRLAQRGWGSALITGPTKAIREAERQRFWHDPNCRFAIGTKAIEKSLNLQVARWAVMLDLLFNPSRIEQFLGRVKRTGSMFDHVHLIRVMCRGTSEEGLIRVVRERQHLANTIHQDVSDIFADLTVNDPSAAQAVLNFGSAA